jgi:hypothetical protein
MLRESRAFLIWHIEMASECRSCFYRYVGLCSVRVSASLSHGHGIPIVDFDYMVMTKQERQRIEAHHESLSPQYPSPRRAIENSGDAGSPMEEALLA